MWKGYRGVVVCAVKVNWVSKDEDIATRYAPSSLK